MKDRTSRDVEALPATPVPATDGRLSADPILMTTATEMNRIKAPMPSIIAPGTNIASLSSPVDVEPTMRSGKPMMTKVMPTPVAATALLLEDEVGVEERPVLMCF